jgi:uncharacterized metal-binding protein YceD (DUF177 family)
MLSSSKFHSDFASWLLATNEVGINGLILSHRVSAEALSALIKEPNDDLFSWISQTPSDIKFIITRENDHAFKINLSGKLTLYSPCTRCLEPVSHEIDLDFTIIMIENAELLAAAVNPRESMFDSESASDGESQTVGYFSGRHLDLGLILREQIFLEVPDYPHCQATCKQDTALLDSTMSTRENPFVKFWKTN